MNIYIVKNLASRIEVRRHSGIHNWFIKHSNSAPMLGQTDDSIVGLFLLTKSNVKFDKQKAMMLFSSCTYLPHFDKAEYSSRDITSMHFASTPINFTRVPNYYKSDYANNIRYDPSDIKVVIKGGKHERGVLDKKSVGKGATGGIFHLISSAYGEQKALESMYNLQQIALRYLELRGMTIGIKDMLIPKSALDKIHVIESAIIDKSLLITQRLNDGKIIPPVGKIVEQFYEEEQISTLRIMDDFAEPILSSIDIDSNNFMSLVLSGSKGTLNHVYHVSSSIGQIVINDKRPKQQYAHGRTFPQFARFDYTPPARGFIGNSYISGMNSVEFACNAQNARADFITKALYTSVTGASERDSIKNLESIILNNLRMCCKARNIIQLLYGEDGLDSRRVVEVNIPTVTCSDAALLAGWKYVSTDGSVDPIFEEEFVRVKSLREEYRSIFLKLERTKYNEPLSASKYLSVDIERIIADVTNQYGTEHNPDVDEIKSMVAAVHKFVQHLGYIMLNDNYERYGLEIPEYMRMANWMLGYYIYSVLNSQNVLRKINLTLLNHIIERIRMKQARAMCEYGTAVGLIAAMSFSEPLTQYMLDAHHRTTTGGTSKSAMGTVKEVLGARSVDQLQAPQMVLIPYKEYQDPAVMQRIATNIETNIMKSFVHIAQVFYERYGEIIHPKYTQENDLIATFEKQNPAIKAPGDLLKWCIRFVLNKSSMIYKNMTIETIINRLRDTYPDLHIVYSTEASKLLVVRIYIRSVYYKGTLVVTQTAIEQLRDDLLATTIRGVPGILAAKVEKIIRHNIKPDGSLDRSDILAIVTQGTNLEGIYKVAEIDPYQIQTDAIDEIQQVLGIEAARQKLCTSIRNLGAGGLRSHHGLVYTDEMTYTGVVTSIERQGLSKRETNNVLLRMGFASPLQTLEEAGKNSMEDPVQGITSPLLVGDVPLSIGTAYNTFHINEGMVNQYTIKPDSYLDTL